MILIYINNKNALFKNKNFMFIFIDNSKKM